MGRHSALQSSGKARSTSTIEAQRLVGAGGHKHSGRSVAERPSTTKAVVATSASFTRAPVARKRVVLPMVGFAATFAFVSASLVNPLSGAYASTSTTPDVAVATAGYTMTGQTYTVAAGSSASASRDAYTVNYTAPVVVKKKAVVTATNTTSTSSSSAAATAAAPTAPAASPGSAQAIGAQLVAARGWGTDQYNCLVSLFNRESGWNVYASNPSGAYGIPQALPGSKMASVGADWQTSASTQITWGLNYIAGRYGTPCGAWAHSQANNWY